MICGLSPFQFSCKNLQFVISMPVHLMKTFGNLFVLPAYFGVTAIALSVIGHSAFLGKPIFIFVQTLQTFSS